MKCRWIIMLVLPVVLSACHDKKQSAVKQHIVVVKKESITTPLDFKGTLEPINNQSVTSPVDGRVRAIAFKYGNSIKQGQELFRIQSKTLEDNFNQAITAYLKAKESFEEDKGNYQGTIALYKSGILSQQDFTNAKNTHNTAILTYYQAKSKLDKILKKVDISFSQVSNITILQSVDVAKLFKSKFENIVVKAPASGVALFPLPDQSSDSKSDGKLRVGSALKEGQLVISIGDLTGYQVDFMVNEIMVNEVKVGMPVTVTGDAFPGITLKGYVSTVASQADPNQSNSGGLSMFDVVVNVPKVKPVYTKTIHVGMSSKLQINIKQKPQLLLPINAVMQAKDGSSYVNYVTSVGDVKQKTVVTGVTTPKGKVVIASGLAVGDKVQVND